MINIAGAVAGLGKQLKNQKQSTAVGSVAPHSHDSSKDSAQQIPPIAPPQPDNITGNLNNNQVIQDKGKALWQGEQMANQFATRQMDQPVPPPGDPIGDGYGDMFNQPFSQKKEVPRQVPRERERQPSTVKENVGGFKERVTPKHKVQKERPRIPLNLIGGGKKPKDPKYNYVGVQNLQEKGKIFNDKKGPYVVNRELTGTSRDTLRLPKNVWRSTDGLIDDVEYRDIANKVNKN